MIVNVTGSQALLSTRQLMATESSTRLLDLEVRLLNTTSYFRTDLLHEFGMSPSTVNLDGLVETWQTLPMISVRKAMKNMEFQEKENEMK